MTQPDPKELRLRYKIRMVSKIVDSIGDIDPPVGDAIAAGMMLFASRMALTNALAAVTHVLNTPRLSEIFRVNDNARRRLIVLAYHDVNRRLDDEDIMDEYTVQRADDVLDILDILLDVKPDVADGITTEEQEEMVNMVMFKNLLTTLKEYNDVYNK